MCTSLYASSVTIDIQAPKIVQHPAESHSFNLNANNVNLTLQCEAVGYQITYKWTKNGRVISPSNRYNIFEGNLTIVNMRPSDRGQYQCKVSNIGGSVISSYAQVIIEGTATVCNIYNPRIYMDMIFNTVLYKYIYSSLTR